MNSLNSPDKTLLEILQQDFPLCAHPFRNIGKACNLDEAQTLQQIETLQQKGFIREISAFINMRRIGFKSTLVALKVTPEFMEEAVARINAHQGVSHNYLREHAFNVWFTLTLEKDKDFRKELENLFSGIPGPVYRILPALKTFKIGINFRFTSREAQKKPRLKKKLPPSPTLSPLERRILHRFSRDFPVVPRPWDEIAGQLNIPVDQLFTAIRKLKNNGIIKRIAAALRHRKAGFMYNGMICFRMPSEKIAAAGKILAGFAEVSHCYQRPTYPDWPYALFAMVHCRAREECDDLILQLATAIDCRDYTVLFSTKEFKKEKLRIPRSFINA